jgi:hypothetical protein
VCSWCETSTHYFSSSDGTCTDSTKSGFGTSYDEIVFLHPVESAVHVVHFGASGA